MSTDQPAAADRPAPAPWWPAALVMLAFLAAAGAMIGFGSEIGRGAFDQVHYHEPAILRFAEQFPRPDVSDYLSGTTPGYHLVLAVAARAVSDAPAFLRAAASLFTVAFLGLLTRWLTPRVGPHAAAALGLATGASLYVFSAGVFLLPDNAAWLGVLAVLILALRPCFDAKTVLAGGAVMLALVLVRQSHLWAAGVLWAAAWLGTNPPPARGPADEIRTLFTQPGRRVGRTLLMALATLPAFAAVAWFVRLWGGLTVPIFHDHMQGTNPATPAFLLAQLGIIGLFHAGYWIGPGLDLARRRPGVVALVVLASLALAAAPDTTYSVEAGRYSGLWNAVRALPTLGGRTSVLLLALTPLGALVLAGWLTALDARSRWVMIAALAGFTAAMSMTLNAWQRYHEPMLLIAAALLSALNARRDPIRGATPGRAVSFARIAGPVLLFLALAAVNVAEHRRAEPAGAPLERKPGIARPLSELWPSSWDRLDRPAKPD